MAENSSTGVRTRHVDTRYHFIREFIEDGFIKVVFVRSVENDADIFTKNVSHDLYVKNTKNFLADARNFSSGWSFQDRKGVGDILQEQPFSFICLAFIR
jgi:hypothetical protein